MPQPCMQHAPIGRRKKRLRASRQGVPQRTTRLIAHRGDGDTASCRDPHHWARAAYCIMATPAGRAPGRLRVLFAVLKEEWVVGRGPVTSGDTRTLRQPPPRHLPRGRLVSAGWGNGSLGPKTRKIQSIARRSDPVRPGPNSVPFRVAAQQHGVQTRACREGLRMEVPSARHPHDV